MISIIHLSEAQPNVGNSDIESSQKGEKSHAGKISRRTASKLYQQTW